MWKLKDLKVETMDLSILMFEIKDELLLKYILENSPWNVKGHYLARKRWEKDMRLDKVDFLTMSFWIQIYNLSVDRINEANGLDLDKRIGNGRTWTLFPLITTLESISVSRWKLIQDLCSPRVLTSCMMMVSLTHFRSR